MRCLIHGPLNRDGDNLRVREVWDHQGQWSLHTLPFVLPHHVIDTIRATPKPHSLDQNDLLSWNYSANGTFNPKSDYAISSNSAASHATRSWKWLWKVPTLPRIITFLWLACQVAMIDSPPRAISTPDTFYTMGHRPLSQITSSRLKG